jgi:nucleoside-diphosphate-sugar epimerase
VLDVVQSDSWYNFDNIGIEHIVHLAGKTFVPDSWDNPEAFFNVNVIGTSNALSFCKRNECSLTYISAYIYGRQAQLPIREDATFVPNNPYAESKYIAEQVCEFYARVFGVNVNVLRLFNVYGPGQRSNFLIPRLLEQIKGERDFIEVMALLPKRDYIYLDDVCEAIRLSMLKCNGYNVYNVGSGISYSVGEVINILQKLAGTNKTVKSLNRVRNEEIDDVIADISKIEDKLNWKPATTFENGLLHCLER